MVTPWKTSNDIIETVKRKIMLPIAQVTFSEEDILAFANEEMSTSQVPSILQYHEEYFVTTKDVSLVSNQSKYPIPDRAIGLRLRALFYLDESNNLLEMTRVLPGDESQFDTNDDSSNSRTRYKLQGNDVVLLPKVGSGTATGSLRFSYYLRPNQLVVNERAAIISFFTESLTVDNTTILPGDTVTINDIVFTAVSGSPAALEFQIGATSVITATNLTTSINTDATYIANNGSPSTAVVTIQFLDQNYIVETSNILGFIVFDTTGVQFLSIPENITNGSKIDFMQTKPGHQIISMDVKIPANGISSNIIEFTDGDVPSTLEIGDYIALQYEAIIPQIPPDLHNVLCERTAARMLASMGDQAGEQSSNAKVQEIEANQSKLIDNRSESDPQKILARHSLLKIGSRRRTNLRGW